GHATTSPPPARPRPLSTPFGRPADSAALGIIRVAYGCTIRFVAMTDTDLIGALRNADAVQFGEFELSHGGTSEYYSDKYRFETDPNCLSQGARSFGARLDDEKLAGVALGAVPL